MKISHLLFPRICPHCQSMLEKTEGLFCNRCAFFFEPLNPKFRCYYCFQENDRRLCDACRRKKDYVIPIGAVWECYGPIYTFMQKLYKEQFPSYVTLATSFLTVQFSRLSFPKPDMIIPVPEFALSFLWKGKSLNHLIAKNLSKSLGIPMHTYLYSLSVNSDAFHLKKRAQIEGKTVLLIDMQYPSAKKWEKLQEAILVGDPEKVCGFVMSIMVN